MPEPVLRPARKPCLFPDPVQFPAGTGRYDPAGQAGVGPEPPGQIRLYRDDPAPGTLGFGGLDFDMSARKIDLVPIEALNLGFTQSRERANGEHRNNIMSSASCSFQ